MSVVGKSWLEEDKLLRRSRVDGHRVVKVLLRGTHRDGHRDTLHHLVDSFADAVGANDFKMIVIFVVVIVNDTADELKQTFLFVVLVSRGEEHVGERRFENLYVVFAVLLDGFSLRETAVADRRVGEDNCRDFGVAHLEV